MESDDDTQSYMCFPLSQIEKNHLEAGNNIIMPASALSSSIQKLVCRMTFRIAKSNSKSTLHYHCGVAEFTADDGFVFFPTWLMKKLNIREGDLVDVKSMSLPEGNYIKVQPHTTEFVTTFSDPISVLKKALRDHVACLISGDSIVVRHKDNKYLMHIVDTKPSCAISLFENDSYEVEFAKPLDYYKQPRRKRFLCQGSGEILEEDDTIYQQMKKTLKYQLSLCYYDNYEVEFATPLGYHKQPRPKWLPGQGSGAISQGDETTYQPMKKKLKVSFMLYKHPTKPQPFTVKMVNVNLPDDVIRNILARVPTKILVQCRCVSAHWHRLISDSFIKSRSCRKILLVAPDFHAIYGPCGDDVVKFHYPFEWQKKCDVNRYIKVIGTFNGIVVLVINHQKYVKNTPKELTSHIILYNPLTGESEILPDPYSPFYEDRTHSYGFGYGATKDDLKIVRVRGLTIPDYDWSTCDVFNLKEKSWSTSTILIEDAICFDDVGTFLNGSLYWCALSKGRKRKIVALNVNEMVISEIHLPCTLISSRHLTHLGTVISSRELTLLGTLHGCLWMITHTENCFKFNTWVMKMEEGLKHSWSESHLLTLDLEDKYKDSLKVTNLMDDGRILLLGARNELIIYDTSKNSYTSNILDTLSGLYFYSAYSTIEYEESLTSPSVI